MQRGFGRRIDRQCAAQAPGLKPDGVAGVPFAHRRDRFACRSLTANRMGPPQAWNMVLTTNQTFAGRSASRRMYQGNQNSP